MPIIKSAKKALRSSARKHVFNLRRKYEMQEILKKVGKEVTAGRKEGAHALLANAFQAIDKAAKRGVIKANTAARKKSRLSAQLAKLSK